MTTATQILRRTTSVGLWGGICGLFGLLVGMGNLALGAMILVGLLLFLAILTGPQLIVALWLVGAPTVFNFANQILKALPFITMERVMFGILVGLVVLKTIFSKQNRYPRLGLETLIYIFLAYMLASLAFSATSTTVKQDLWFFLQYAMPMLMFPISRRIEWSERGAKILLACLTVTGVILAIIGILQSLFGLTIFTMEYQDVTSGHVGRAYGTFTNAHTYIATLFIFLSVTIFQFGMYRDGLLRSLLLCTMFGMLLGIVLGETRAPWLGTALALFIIMLRDRSVRPLLVVGGVVAFIAGLVVMALMIDKLGAFIERVTTLSTMADRLATWATAVNMIVHNPLVGIGFGADAFDLHKPEYITGIGPLSAQFAVYLVIPHNEYLHVTVLLGLPGLALFIGILASVVRLMFRIHADPDSSVMRRRLAVYVGATIIGLLFNSLFSDTYVQDYFWMLAWFLAGFVAGLPQRFGQPEPVETRGRGVS